jgi:hypothetical protein
VTGRISVPRLALAVAISLPVLGLAAALGARTPETPLLIDDAEPRVTVALSPSELTVGDRVDAVLTVSAPEKELAGPPRFPDWETHWGSAEILEVGPPETLVPRGGVASFRQKLVLAAFRPGEVPLPPQEVEVPLATGPVRVATAPELSFEISPVLPPREQEEGRGDDRSQNAVPGTVPGTVPEATVDNGEGPELELRPEDPLRTLPLTRAFWVAAGALGAVCLALVLLLWRQVGPPVPRPEKLTARDRLERDLAAVPKAASLAEAHALLSRALRRYLGRQLGFPAPESTTTQIRRELTAHRLPAAAHRGAAEILAACDLVKFARRPSTRGVLDRRVEIVRRVGRELETHPLQPPEASMDRPSPGGMEDPP